MPITLFIHIIVQILFLYIKFCLTTIPLFLFILLFQFFVYHFLLDTYPSFLFISLFQFYFCLMPIPLFYPLYHFLIFYIGSMHISLFIHIIVPFLIFYRLLLDAYPSFLSILLFQSIFFVYVNNIKKLFHVDTIICLQKCDPKYVVPHTEHLVVVDIFAFLLQFPLHMYEPH